MKPNAITMTVEQMRAKQEQMRAKQAQKIRVLEQLRAIAGTEGRYNTINGPVTITHATFEQITSKGPGDIGKIARIIKNTLGNA
jgi:hypothetical protein